MRALALSVLGVSTTLGCGGGGPSINSVPPGRYVGTWSDGADDAGNVDLTVAGDRTLFGSLATGLLALDALGPGQAQGTLSTGGMARLRGLWYREGSELPDVVDYSGTLRYDPPTGKLTGSLGRGGNDLGLPRHRSAWTLVRR